MSEYVFGLVRAVWRVSGWVKKGLEWLASDGGRGGSRSIGGPSSTNAFEPAEFLPKRAILESHARPGWGGSERVSLQLALLFKKFRHAPRPFWRSRFTRWEGGRR